MKSSRLMIAVVFALFALLASAAAQTEAIQAKVPFDFTVGKQTLTAGVYRVMINGPAMLRVARTDGPDVAGIMTNCVKVGSKDDLRPRLVFHRYGNHYFLAQAWIGGVNVGHQLYASPAELELARTTKPESTTILAAQIPVK